MENEPECKEKNKQVHIEVRFQRHTSQSLKNEAAAFRKNTKGEHQEYHQSMLPILVCTLISQEVYQILLLVI